MLGIVLYRCWGRFGLFGIDPNLSDIINEADKFEIVSRFNVHDKVNGTAIEVPFWANRFDGNEIDKRMLIEIGKCLNKLR